MKKLIVLFLFISPALVAQQNYYVATTGDNDETGNLTAPWKTVHYGIDQLTAGDTLFILAGTYYEKLDIDVSGTAANYITIKNYQNDEVLIDGSTIDNDASLIWTDNAYLRIEGLHLTNNIGNFKEGLSLQGAAHHIDIIGNKISNIKFSSDPNETVTRDKNAVPLNIYADSATDSIHNIRIKGNEVFNNQTGYSENISAGGNFSTFIIEDNVVHDNTNIGIDIGGNYKTVSVPGLDHGRHGVIRNNLVYNCNAPYSTAAGIYIDGGFDIVVENNICHHNGYGGEIGCEENGTTENIIFRNNIFYQNFYTGMHIGGYDTNTTGIVINAKVYNNTFYQNDQGENYSGEIALTQLNGCELKNNIFYVSDQNLLLNTSRTQDNLILDYNLVFSDAGNDALIVFVENDTQSLAAFTAASGQRAHSIFGNPNFMNANNSDFHIAEDSKAIDAGDPAFTTTEANIDIDGQPRINKTVDCGADESSTSIIVVEPGSSEVVLYPNPTKDSIYLPESLNGSLYRVYALDGKLVSKGSLNANGIDLADYAQGLYYVQITKEASKYSFKVLRGVE